MPMALSAEHVQIALKVLVSIAILLCGFLLGRLVEKLSLKAIENLGLRRRVRFGLEREMRKFGFSADIIKVLGLMIKYFVYFSALVVVVDYLQVDAVRVVVESVWRFLPRVLVSVAIVIIGSVFVEFAVDIVKFNLRSIGADRFADETKTPRVSSIVSKLMKFFLYLILVIMALSSLGVEMPLVNALTTSLGVSAIVAIVLLGVLGLKDVLPDMTSGVYIRNSSLLKEGDKIVFGNIRGKVIRVGLLMTEIRSGNGVEFVPNSSLLGRSFTKVA